MSVIDLAPQFVMVSLKADHTVWKMTARPVLLRLNTYFVPQYPIYWLTIEPRLHLLSFTFTGLNFSFLKFKKNLNLRLLEMHTASTFTHCHTLIALSVWSGCAVIVPWQTVIAELISARRS